MNITVLLSSGDVDEYTDMKDARMDMNLMGALLLVEQDDTISAMYAPGMWMKVEFDR